MCADPESAVSLSTLTAGERPGTQAAPITATQLWMLFEIPLAALMCLLGASKATADDDARIVWLVGQISEPSGPETGGAI